MKVLFVDDERIIREGMSEIIHWDKLGCGTPAMAESGDRALEMMRLEDFDLVITDIYMQRMTGIELAKKIKEFWPQVKVIILSAYEDFGYAREAIEAGVFKYLLKPIVPEELEKAVKEAMEQVHSDTRLMNQAIESEKIVDIYRPQLAKDFWKALLRGEISEREDLEQRMYLAGIVLPGKGVCCMAVSVKPERDRLDKKAVLETLEAAESSLRGVLDCVRQGESCLVLLLAEVPSEQEIMKFEELMERRPEGADPDRKLCIACGRLVTDLRTLNQSLEDAVTMLNSRAEDGQEGKDLISQSIRLIHRNLSEAEFGVNEIADTLHVSTGYFSRLFKKQMGTTCIDYITKQRIEKAKELLAHTDLKHELIAGEVGYSNVYYFSLQFKKQTGETPGQYRKRMVEEGYV